MASPPPTSTRTRRPAAQRAAARRRRVQGQRPPAAKAAKTAKAPAAEKPRLSRPVMWTGIAAGTFLGATAVNHGIRLALVPLRGLPGAAANVLLTIAVMAGLGVLVAELARRHHKATGRAAWRHGRRGASATFRGSRRHSGRLVTWLAALPARAAASAPSGEDITAAASTPAPTPKPRVCMACGNPEGGKHGPLVRYHGPDGPLIVHKAHFEDPRTGLYGEPYEELTPTTNGRNDMAPSRIDPDRRARRTATRTGGNVPSAWGPVIGAAADFEPENDGHLLEWLAGEVSGMTGYAEGLIDAYQTGTETVGIDPKALTLLHDVADAVAHAAEVMAEARKHFTEHYELPREFAANGGLMPHKGRWVTGDGE